MLVKKGATARVHCVDFGRLQSRVLVPSGDDLTDSLERRHEGRAFIQHGQNLVSGLGRKHQDDPINAGVTVAFQHLQVSGRPEDVEGERRGIAAGVLCHLSELRQHLERIQRTPADEIQPSP